MISIINQAVTLFTNKSNKLDRLYCFILILIVAVISILMVFFGPAPMKAPWDVFCLLDGGWRIISGHIPHVDYYNPIGPLTYLLIAAGMKIGIPSLASLVYGNLLFG